MRLGARQSETMRAMTPGPDGIATLVTGATGFLGGHLCREMSRRGMGFAVLARSRQKAGPMAQRGIEVRWGDLGDEEACARAVRGQAAVIHLAAAADVSDAAVNEAVNVKGLGRLLSACRREGVRRFVFLSSTCAGRAHRDAYGETKRVGEELVKGSGLDFTILRPTMIYGAGSKEFETFVEVVRRSPVVPIIGSGRHVIQPVHVDDAVGVILAVLGREACLGRTYDVAGGTRVSFDELVELVRTTLRLRRRWVLHVPAAPLLVLVRALGRMWTHVPLTVDQVMAFIQDTVIDLAPLERDVGFAPRPLDLGLRQVLSPAREM
jgi:nucleoside-diphosphate-sugar epimerase